MIILGKEKLFSNIDCFIFVFAMNISYPIYLNHIIVLDAIVLLVWLFIWLLKAILKKESVNNIENLFIAVAFANLGLIFGIFTGLSDSPVVGVLITSFIALFGGLITFFTVKDKESSIRSFHTALLGILIIPITLLFGLEIGAKDRLEFKQIMETEQFEKEVAKMNFEKLKKDSTYKPPIFVPKIK